MTQENESYISNLHIPIKEIGIESMETGPKCRATCIRQNCTIKCRKIGQFSEKNCPILPVS